MTAMTQNMYEKENTATLAKQAEFSRNLKKAQANQQQKQAQQHIQNTTNNIQIARPPIAPTTTQKTDAQQKQALRGQQRWHARVIQARKRKKRIAGIQKKYEKIIRQYVRVSWMLIYVAAVSDAFFDLLLIPILSTFMSFCTSLYINAALWNVGGAKGRAKRRIIRASVSTMDLIPIINLIPFSILIVYKTKEDEKKRAKRARKALKKLSKL